MGILNKIGNGIKAFTSEISKPDSFVKGEEFEDYVRNVLFPKSEYDLIHRTHNYNSNNGDFVESSLKPDFTFRDRKTDEVFYIEVKWRAGYYNFKNKIEWCNKNQLYRYKKIDKKEHKVFIALGLGDNPKKPSEIALFPVSTCRYTELYDSYINKYLFYVDKPVFSNYLWKLK